MKAIAIFAIILLAAITASVHAQGSIATITFNSTSYAPCVEGDIGKWMYLSNTGQGIGFLLSFDNAAYTWTVNVTHPENFNSGMVGWPVGVARGSGAYGFVSAIDDPVVPEIQPLLMLPLLVAVTVVTLTIKKWKR